MGNVITNLKAKFSVDAQDVPKGMKPAEDALTNLDKSVKKNITGLKNLIPPITALGIAGGAFALLKGSLEALEGPSDKIESTMSGLKEALFETQRALGTMDFSGFLSNIKDGYESGKEFSEMLDDLADKSAYNDYRINQLKRESAELQELVKNKTLELSARTDAAERVQVIEAQIQERRVQLAQRQFQIEKAQWEDRNKMNADEALKLYESIDKWGPEVEKRMQEAYERAKADRGPRATDEQITDRMTKITDFSRASIEAFVKFMNLVKEGETDVLIKLFGTYKNIEETAYKAQEDYNSTIAQTTRLLAEEERQAKKTGESLPAQGVGIGNADTSNLSASGLDQVVTTLRTQRDEIGGITDDIEKSMNDMSATINQALSSSLVGLGTFLGELASGASETDELANMVGQALGGLLVQLGEVCIETGVGLLAIKEAFTSGNGYAAIAAGVALVALGSYISSAVSSIGADMDAPAQTGYNRSFDTTGYHANISQVNVNLTGELKARGNELVAVIENENNRLFATT